jgi:osmoprotectant transport system permease protein
MILAGAIPAALLAILFDFLLSLVQKMNLKSFRRTGWIFPLLLLLLSSFYILPSTGNKLQAGFTPEFMGREDGWLGLKSKYKLDIHTVVISDAVMYKAAYEKKLDVISGYSTDGRLKAYDLVTLQDDKLIFPPYHAAPVIRQDILQKYPELEPVLNRLSGTINDSIMTELNYRTDQLHQSPEKVARDFLSDKGLYKSPHNGEKATIRLGSKIFGEQYILINMYKMLIEGYTDLMVETRTGLGGTKICFDALRNGYIDMYPEYTGTGLLVILHPDKQRLGRIIGNKDSVYSYVKAQFERQYHLTWLRPIGFNNAYALMMRRQQAGSLKIKSISGLQEFLSAKEK